MSRGRSSALPWAFVCALVVSACTVNPVTRQREMVLATPEQEAEAGREAAELVAREMGIVEDPSVTSYVVAVGERVAAHAPDTGIPYQFQVVDLMEPNAFALPGGYVYVSRGILTIANSEDELANVVAHEVVHVAARHHAQRSTRAAGIGLLALPGLLAGAILPGPIGRAVAAPFAVAGMGVLASYSRDQERESDRFGQEMAAAGGYDPEALARFLASLDRVIDMLVEEPENPSFFDTHPTTPSRLDEALKHAQSISWSPQPGVAGGHAAFLRRIDGLLLGDNPAEGVFDDERFLHPDLDLTVVFPKGWRTINTRRAVGAVQEGSDVQLALSHEGKGTDPREAASAFLTEAARHARVDVASTDYIEVNGREAVRVLAVAHGRGGAVNLDLSWIVHEGDIYLLSGAVGKEYSDEHRALFGRVAQSFRSLTPAERGRITERRLRVREAHAGETLESFCHRTGNRWTVQQTALANALSQNGVLAEGQLVKIALEQPYQGRAR